MTMIASLHPTPMNLEKSCLEKARYSTELVARQYARGSIIKRPDTPRLWVYPCINCRGWHMTGKPGSSASPTAVTRQELYEGTGI
jgi:hypothetical protein